MGVVTGRRRRVRAVVVRAVVVRAVVVRAVALGTVGCVVMAGCSTTITGTPTGASGSSGAPGPGAPSTSGGVPTSAGVPDPGAAAPSVPAGSTQVTDTTSKFTVALPAGWVVVKNPTGGDVIDVSGGAPVDAPAAAADAATSAFNQGAKLLAVNATESPFASNVTVLVNDAAGADPTDVMQAVPSVTQELATANAQQVRTAQTTVDGIPALQVDYTITAPGKAVTVTGRQLYVIHNGTVYITTITTNSPTSAPATDLITTTLHFP